VASEASTSEPSRNTAAVTGPQQEEARWRTHRRYWTPASLPKGASRLVWRAGPLGTIRRWGLPLMTMLPLGGAN
jgi:hypothetical protein